MERERGSTSRILGRARPRHDRTRVPYGNRAYRSPHCLCQHRKPVAGARSRPAEGVRDSRRGGRRSFPFDSTVVGGEPAAGSRRRDAGLAVGQLGCELTPSRA